MFLITYVYNLSVTFTEMFRQPFLGALIISVFYVKIIILSKHHFYDFSLEKYLTATLAVLSLLLSECLLYINHGDLLENNFMIFYSVQGFLL